MVVSEMSRQSTQAIEAIRRFNRFYTQHLGVLEEGFLQSEFTLTQARIIYELAQRHTATATDLQGVLGHNAGYLSRVLKGLHRNGYIEIRPSPDDGRERLLSLTPKGQEAFARLDTRSHEQIAGDLARLAPTEQVELVRSVETVRHLLEGESRQAAEVTFRSHRPGDIGWIVELHGEIYAREYGWNAEFEAVVAEICAHFLREFREDRDRCWIAERAGVRVGCVMLEHHPEREGVARLRLLLVHPQARGAGLGRRLVDTCTAFAREAGYYSITLWTMNALVQARHIYRSSGYRLVNEEPVTSFGHDLVSETWELTL
jgi:DNA-binding MarR family transcriptional regulator/GNAT superfamily N-acetyltransferase